MDRMDRIDLDFKTRIAEFEKKFAATHLATPPPPAPKLVRQDAHHASDAESENDSSYSDTSDSEMDMIHTLCKIVNDYVVTTEIYHIIFPGEKDIRIVDKT